MDGSVLANASEPRLSADSVVASLTCCPVMLLTWCRWCWELLMQSLLRVVAAAGIIVSAAALRPAQATEMVLYNFKNRNTGNPTSRLLLRSGDLFGVGIGYDGCCGGVFKLTNANGPWSRQTLVKFSGGEGKEPFAGLTPGAGGWLYGTASLGGKYGGGTVFRTKQRTLQVLWNFGNGSDGAVPNGDLKIDSTGTIYGTTFYGGTGGGYGTVFSLAYSGGAWKEQLLHSFTGDDGGFPGSGVVLGGGNTIYGTSDGPVFKLTQSGGVWTWSMIYNPGDASHSTLVRDSNGNLFGTTVDGGPYTAGTVFKLSYSGGVWTETDLYTFKGGNDGLWPEAGLHLNNDGSLYGTTRQGGTHSVGTVFKVSEAGGVWSEEVLYSFAGGNHDGAQPFGAVIVDQLGNIYGTTPFGGTGQYGTVYEITP